MRTINARHEIITPIDGTEILKTIEAIGRTCYKSEDKITGDSCIGFVQRIIQRGHEAILEHFNIKQKGVKGRSPRSETLGECPKNMTISDVIEILYQDMRDYSIPLSNGETILVQTTKAETAWIIGGRLCCTYVEASAALMQTLYRKLIGADFTLHYSETMNAPDAITASLLPDGRRVLNLANGKHIEVCSVPDGKHPGFDFRVDSQYFSRKDYANIYLTRLIYEKLTGKRIITHAKREVPQICGINGAACRNKACTSALCYRCPIAEGHFAQMDGVKLVYAVDWEELEI